MSNKLINEVQLLHIGQRILHIDDTRIKQYREGDISQTEFLLSLTDNDPFYIVDGGLSIVTNVDKITLANARKKVITELYIEQGNIDCVKLYENKEILLSVYPELKKVVKEVEKDLKLNGKCGITRRTNLILLELLKIKYDGRDISVLKNIIGELGILRLTEQEINIDIDQLLENDYVYKRFCK